MSSNGGGSGRFSAIVAKWVGSSSARSRSKKRAISSSKAATRPWTSSISRSIIAPCCSISVSRRPLRAVILVSVSSRIRAISAFDHSRTAATSSSAWRRSVFASVAERSWIFSTWPFASAWNWASVSFRSSSAAVCMAFVRSARNLLGFFGVGARAGSGRRGREVVGGRLSRGPVRAPARVDGLSPARCAGRSRGGVGLGPAAASVGGGGVGLIGLGLLDVRTLRAPGEPEAGAGVGLSHGCGASPLTAGVPGRGGILLAGGGFGGVR